MAATSELWRGTLFRKSAGTENLEELGPHSKCEPAFDSVATFLMHSGAVLYKDGISGVVDTKDCITHNC